MDQRSNRQPHRGLGLPDYRLTDIAEKHIRRGLCLLCKHAPVALLLPIAISIGVSAALQCWPAPKCGHILITAVCVPRSFSLRRG